MKLFIAAVLAMVLATDADTALPELSPPLSDSLSASLRRQFDAMTSPALEARKAARRRLQQAGYASVLADVLSDDGWGSLLSLARMNAQIEYTIPHRPLSIFIPVTPSAASKKLPPWFFTYKSGPVEIVLHDDWSMPEDPWTH